MQNLQDLEGEIWKDIIEYEGHYQISNMGRVKSLERIFISQNNAIMPIKEKILKGGYMTAGYKSVVLCKNKIQKSFSIHRLVAIAFIPNPENKPQVNHKNGIRDDNREVNLDWMTNSENGLHSYKYLGRKSPKAMLGKSGALHNRSKTIYKFSMDGKFLTTYESVREAGRLTGFNPAALSGAAVGKFKLRYGYRWSYNDKPNPL